MSMIQWQAIFARLDALERALAELQAQQVKPQLYTPQDPYIPERRPRGRPRGSTNGA